ncbi:MULTISPECIES: molybdenum cofactor biosynthesis F family protein [Paraliobacillus]|uniref:molybdenum cofactor biosynthesis F family protein n=1 Tax=Paraliobacillus TaxID=200903 RepID=UPI000DD2D282|nr:MULTISPECIES: molybdenum cofactor biosynthesis F family protein [Paraliobacillus]
MSTGNNTQKFISVGELSVGFSENIIEPTEHLVGKEFSFFYKTGKTGKISFLDRETVKWSELEEDKEVRYISSYTAINPRDNIYFIDFIASYGNTKSISIILDGKKQIATVISGVLPTTAEVSIPMLKRAEQAMPLTSVKANIEHVSVNSPFTESTFQHQETKDLIGKRVQFQYSSKDIYEHIYLNENMCTWHCISGNEKGLSDTDKCFYYKLDEDFYLFIWLEKVIPTMGIVLEDLNVLRSYGKIYGYEDYTAGKISNFPVGSFAKLMNNEI